MESLTHKNVEKYTGTFPMSSLTLKCTRFVVDFGFVFMRLILEPGMPSRIHSTQVIVAAGGAHQRPNLMKRFPRLIVSDTRQTFSWKVHQATLGSPLRDGRWNEGVRCTSDSIEKTLIKTLHLSILRNFSVEHFILQVIQFNKCN